MLKVYTNEQNDAQQQLQDNKTPLGYLWSIGSLGFTGKGSQNKFCLRRVVTGISVHSYICVLKTHSKQLSLRQCGTMINGLARIATKQAEYLEKDLDVFQIKLLKSALGNTAGSENRNEFPRQRSRRRIASIGSIVEPIVDYQEKPLSQLTNQKWNEGGHMLREGRPKYTVDMRDITLEDEHAGAFLNPNFVDLKALANEHPSLMMFSPDLPPVMNPNTDDFLNLVQGVEPVMNVINPEAVNLDLNNFLEPTEDKAAFPVDAAPLAECYVEQANTDAIETKGDAAHGFDRSNLQETFAGNMENRMLSKKRKITRDGKVLLDERECNMRERQLMSGQATDHSLLLSISERDPLLYIADSLWSSGSLIQPATWMGRLNYEIYRASRPTYSVHSLAPHFSFWEGDERRGVNLYDNEIQRSAAHPVPLQKHGAAASFRYHRERETEMGYAAGNDALKFSSFLQNASNAQLGDSIDRRRTDSWQQGNDLGFPESSMEAHMGKNGMSELDCVEVLRGIYDENPFTNMTPANRRFSSERRSSNSSDSPNSSEDALHRLSDTMNRSIHAALGRGTIGSDGLASSFGDSRYSKSKADLRKGVLPPTGSLGLPEEIFNSTSTLSDTYNLTVWKTKRLIEQMLEQEDGKSFVYFHHFVPHGKVRPQVVAKTFYSLLVLCSHGEFKAEQSAPDVIKIIAVNEGIKESYTDGLSHTVGRSVDRWKSGSFGGSDLHSEISFQDNMSLNSFSSLQIEAK